MPQYVDTIPNKSHISAMKDDYDRDELASPNDVAVPSLWGVPLKYISLVTLAVQNSLLTIIMHYSRVYIPPGRGYSAALAVLLNEILKGSISFAIAFARIESPTPLQLITPLPTYTTSKPYSYLNSWEFFYRLRRLAREIFSPDCWKLSIPAILYVIQNNLQFVAASNLDAATFQVSYQMKILTTAAFSVFLLRKRLSPSQWLALVCLAVGVGIVQVQSGVKGGKSVTIDFRAMRPVIGFAAVTAACFTSGLAGVYFEMVLKNSQTNLWVRNVQLSLFSLLPAVAPILLSHTSNGTEPIYSNLFRNFGLWAWATVAIQVLGGLLTALVIKYSDNILKGFATSLSIVISFLASVLLFDFRISFTFVLGSVIVLIATWLYNQPPRRAPSPSMKETLSLSLSLSASLAEKGRPVGPVRSPTQEFASYAVSRSTSLSSFTTLPDPEFDMKNPRI